MAKGRPGNDCHLAAVVVASNDVQFITLARTCCCRRYLQLQNLTLAGMSSALSLVTTSSNSGNKLKTTLRAAKFAVMRTSRALRLLIHPSRLPCAASRIGLPIRRGYCVACEPPAPTVTATPATNSAISTKNPPIPPADHRQLGIEQELFTTSIYSPGSPLFLPNGVKLFNKLQNFLRAQYEYFGFQEVITPTIYKKSLWEKSGHWENYADDMYAVTGRGASGEKEGRQIGEDEEYGLKPMNCPGHCLIFASKQRSYRDLPIRYADFSPLHRNEIHGALSGLTRVRRFHQDDGHIFCRPSQIKKEISKTLEFVQVTYNVLGLGPYRLALSTRPKDHFIGEIEEWDDAEEGLRQSLDKSGMPWTLNEGDGAFYGPKIDIILKDTDGKEHQTATIQLDFQLPKRFDLSYQAPAPELEQRGITTDDPKALEVVGPVTPVLIHRAVLGSVERIMALLIEHYNGQWPFWLNPRQVVILTVNDKAETVLYAQRARTILRSLGSNHKTPLGAMTIEERLSVDIDSSPRSLKKKIAEAKSKHYSVIIVVGGQDVESNRLMVDFTGVPDPFNKLVQSGLLRKVAGARKELKDGNGKMIDPHSEQTANSLQLPNLEPAELKNFAISTGLLKNFLAGLQKNHF